MFDIHPISAENLQGVQPLYEAFQKVAQTDYGWPHGAIDFGALGKIFEMGLMQGYLIRDFQADRPVGFLFYQAESFGAMEIKVIYLAPDLPVKTVLDLLMNRFMADGKTIDGWEVLSYPLLGEAQLRYVRYLTWYGLKPIGQLVVKFHMFDGISLEIFKKQALPDLPVGYRMVSWDPKYEEGVVDIIAEAFAESVDALWDPRFRSREGVAEAIAFVQSGAYGIFWPDCTTILLNEKGQPAGVCFLNIVSQDEANIPLIGLLKSERQKGLGKQLLAQTVDRSVHEALTGKLQISLISATTATANIPAVRMYRHLAFREDYWYPHLYQNRSSVIRRRPGQWC